MKKKSKNEKENQKEKYYYFTIICLSSDVETYKPLMIIKKYLTLEQSSNIKYDNWEIEYDHSSNATNSRMTKCKFYEILDIYTQNPNCSLADSYLIFINLESEGLKTQIDELLTYINQNGKNEMKIYFIGLYLNRENIYFLNEKGDITKYLEEKGINFEYEELNFDSSNDLVEIMSYITNDTLKNKTYESLNQTLDKEKGKGNSICIIF